MWAARRSDPGSSGLLLGEVADHGQLEVLALEALDHQDDPADEEGEQDDAEQGADGTGHVGPDHRDQGPQDPVDDRLYGVEADLGTLVDQVEDQAGEPGQHVGQAGGDVLGHAAACRRVLAARLLVRASGLLVAPTRLLAVLALGLAPALVAGRWRRRGRWGRAGVPAAALGRRWRRGARRLPARGLLRSWRGVGRWVVRGGWADGRFG